MAWQGKIEGIFTPHMIPLDERAEINEPELRRYVDWLIRSGVHGLYPNGSTSEFLRFTPQERRRIVEIVLDAAAGRVPVLAGAAEANVRETLAACQHYRDLGVRAVAIVAPFYYRLSPDNVYAYFREIGRNTPVDVTLYNIPMFASPIDVPTIQRLSEECERIIAIKDSSGDLQNTNEYVRVVPDRFAVMQGRDTLIYPSLIFGARGSVPATANVAPKLAVAIYEAFQRGDHTAAKAAQLRLNPVRLSLTLGTAPGGVKAALALLGTPIGPSRSPVSPLSREKQQQMRAALEQAGLPAPALEQGQ